MWDSALFVELEGRMPDPGIVRQVFLRTLRRDGNPLTARQRLTGTNALLKILHLAEAEPDDVLVNEIKRAVRQHGPFAPLLVQALYDAEHEGAYESLATFVAWDLEEELQWPTILSAVLIVRPKDVALLIVGDA